MVMRAFSYRNLHKNCFSVRDEATGRVALREDFVCLSNASLVVGQKGRERVLKEKQKNIHAGVRGDLHSVGFEAVCAFHARDGWVEVYYNPYKTSTFVVKETGVPVLTAKMVFLGKRGAFALLD
jgi:hypothetical protein